MDTKSILILVGLFAFIVIFKLISQKLSGKTQKESVAKEPTVYRYERKNYIMSRAENDFYKLLVDAAGPTNSVFPQVHLSAIIEHRVKGQNWKGAFSHINGKSVDYVICDKVSNRPLVAVELDDSSHEAEDRRTRDTEVERIFDEAKMPLLRFPGANAQSPVSVRQRVAEVLSN